MKFCVECKHSIDDGGGVYKLKCGSPNNSVDYVNESYFLVSGEKQPTVKAMRGASCTALRTRRSPEIDSTVCGPDGKWFEAKES